MARANRFGSRFLTGVVLLLPFAGCDSDTSVRPPMTVVTTQAPQPVHAWLTDPPATIGGFESDTWIALPIPLSVRGVMDIRVDWTFPNSWIYVYFGDKSCEYVQLAARTCPFLLSSETQSPKPRVLTTGLLEPGTYYLVFHNVLLNRRTGVGSENTETLQVQLGVTIPPSAARQAVAVGTPVLLQRGR